MPSSAIPSIPLTFPPVASTTMTSMPSGSVAFQGFPFGSGHIPHATPSLNIGSLPFSSQGQRLILFKEVKDGLTLVLVVWELGIGPFSLVNKGIFLSPLLGPLRFFLLSLMCGTLIKGFPLLLMLRWGWGGGDFSMFGNPLTRGGHPLNTSVPQGFPYGSTSCTNNSRQPTTSTNPVYYFLKVGNPTHGGWNSPAPQRLPFLETLC